MNRTDIATIIKITTWPILEATDSPRRKFSKLTPSRVSPQNGHGVLKKSRSGHVIGPTESLNTTSGTPIAKKGTENVPASISLADTE
jgi:hypothetical protein